MYLSLPSNDVERTYTHLAERVRRSQEEQKRGGSKTIMLASQNESDITFNVPASPPPAKLVLGEGIEGMEIEEGLPENLQKALQTEELAEVNKVLGDMEVEEAK
ncbi:hypothetical protein B0H19DRAFT_1062612 [Mycena capillaripes]|nr:hypothetical protein B0H19DRAFT_1062612 [Mycena capillaripes]